ncbi:hypothetical protein UA08_02908 [Talaromyces atroroseus]|uniref:Uncharacterized protein n=1 Tax=Talaromyces atroroseus TaxID=1441469 RepID=A0A225ANJ4_TALAT|nr:hypothetical protein UA08_02908 [Talaromyces atroroseus]OKL62460.1 hypothetical protein UA08_02908 [Talaromyces atroroseus]
MIPPLPSATPTWHNDTYQSISPSRPELNVSGKTVIITGAGSGIGQEAALTFAKAGASKLVLLGRDESKLAETQRLVAAQAESKSENPSVIVCDIFPVSVTDEKTMQDIAGKVGTWDVLILAAGFLSTPGPVVSSPLDDWWQSFETNVKGTVIAANVFLPTARLPPADSSSIHPSAAILSLTTGPATTFPAGHLKGLSAYMSSKTAGVKLIEFLAAENPHVFCASVHPGMVETYIFNKSLSNAAVLPMDTVQLPAHFLLWMASPEAGFLNGRTVWANWDVDELKAMAAKIEAGRLMTVGLEGWPFS